jgi:hypothetical protein
VASTGDGALEASLSSKLERGHAENARQRDGADRTRIHARSFEHGREPTGLRQGHRLAVRLRNIEVDLADPACCDYSGARPI